MPLADGAKFAGYTIERLLGTGGMGEVYLVRHPRLPRQEALKILPASVSADEEYRQRFAREADNAAALWHPHIVAVHDRGEHDGQLWIAMDYVDGTDAAQLMRSRYPLGMPPNEALEIVSAIADALDYAHERYLLHRDVKPANILLTDPRRGARRTLLADFGIARAVDDGNNLTATNMTVGSVAYAAPEQLMGKPLDGRADQYALACTAFHLLTGGPPFGNTNPAVVIGNHLSSPAPTLASVRADLGAIDDVLARAMTKEPYQRFETCREFAAALVQGSAGSAGYADATQFAVPAAAPAPPVVARETASAGGSNQITISRRVAAIAGGVAVLVVVGLVAFLGARLGQSPAEAPTASPQKSTLIRPEPTVGPSRPQRTVTQTAPPVTVTKPGQPPAVPPLPPSRPPGDLGLETPISSPSCDGQGIVVLGSVTTPGQYAAGVQRLLNVFPGSSYLRTDRSCPSLRQATEEGDPIYTVFRTAGTTQGQVCAAVRAAGGDSYGKWLDTTTDSGYMITC
ncbi:serine/threonine-protein kinase [Mycobacterium sp. URHB0044]|uniref:serine/threonine-protein kinase n=1 Tax=Mycobacterium sp. URHB0044 TaxID=1380386 RepID=UPI00048A8F63|nr:serine/threonine-protein kinase [Mycobacterium sp. URHB0044]